MYYGNHRHCNQSLKEGEYEVRKGVIQLGFKPIGSFFKPVDDFYENVGLYEPFKPKNYPVLPKI